MNFNYVWTEIEKLKQRVEELERKGLSILEEDYSIVNDENLDREIEKIVNELKRLVQKHGVINLQVTTEN